MTTTLAARQGQTLFDIALMQYGSLDGGLAQLLADNPESLDANGLFPVGAFDWRVRPAFFANRNIADKMTAVVPVSGERDSGDAWVTDDGQQWITDDGQTWITELN